MFGFVKVASIAPRLSLGDVKANVATIKEAITAHKEAAVLLFPEMSLTGYTLADLFFQDALYKEVLKAIKELEEAVLDQIVIVGAPIWHKDRLYNTALLFYDKKLRGVVPKSYLANYREFYEKRWFSPGKEIKDDEWEGVPFGVDLLFKSQELLLGIEICEDLWSVIPPSFYQALAGANLICNLSASDEIVGKHDYRKELVKTQSARCVSAYAYSSSSLFESSQDVCYSGATLIAENGAILAEGERFCLETSSIVADIDLQKLRTLRRAETSFADNEALKFRIVELGPLQKSRKLYRFIDPHPFVPSNPAQKAKRSKEILAIQSSALARRILHIGSPKLVVGISGGLDSTLALLVCVEACRKVKKPLKDIVAISMPGLGTTSKTKNDAKELCKVLGVDFREISIEEAVLYHFKNIGHDPEKTDVVFENAQARERTQILMDIANEVGGIVVGTGDLSELALGFCTYNADQMAMYNVNAGVPKTLVRYLIEYVASTNPKLEDILRRIISRPVSPELLPPKGDEITQKTEDILGPYELHDFFLYHFVKYGASPCKIIFLAKEAFKEKYSKKEIKEVLLIFLKRFFANQFKRDPMPDGVKVGTIALSPRGDWRMPSDAEVRLWIEELEDGCD